MNFSFLQKLLFFLIVITISCEAKDCDYSCLSKTYSYADVSVTFTGKQVDGVNYLTINLIGNNINEFEAQQITVTINKDSESNAYYCERTKKGQTKAYYQTQTTSGSSGSSIYQHNQLSCSWTMSKDDMDYPKYSGGSPFNLEFDPDFSIGLATPDFGYFIVTGNIVESPIYQMKFLKCCNKVHGNDKVQFFVRQTDKSNEFNVFPLVDGYSYVSVVLTDSDSTSLGFEVYYSGQKIDGYIKQHDGSVFYISSQFLYKQISNGQLGTWLIPLIINETDKKYDTRKKIYDLKISLDDKIVYTEKGISFNSGSIKILNLFIVFLAFVIHQMLWY